MAANQESNLDFQYPNPSLSILTKELEVEGVALNINLWSLIDISETLAPRLLTYVLSLWPLELADSTVTAVRLAFIVYRPTSGGISGHRTHDLLLAGQALSHLSYNPVSFSIYII